MFWYWFRFDQRYRFPVVQNYFYIQIQTWASLEYFFITDTDLGFSYINSVRISVSMEKFPFVAEQGPVSILESPTLRARAPSRADMKLI